VAMLHEDLIEVMPAVEEANSISEELDKKVKFEIMLISASMREKMDAKEVCNLFFIWCFELARKSSLRSC
jgi:hypothetical protein